MFLRSGHAQTDRPKEQAALLVKGDWGVRGVGVWGRGTAGGFYIPPLPPAPRARITGKVTTKKAPRGSSSRGFFA